MKIKKLFNLAFIATIASFTACENITDELISNDSEIRLTSSITPVTRATNQNLQAIQIVTGQQVGVTITGAKSEHNNIAWTAGEDGALTNTGDAIYYGNSTATITAYHPYNSSWIGTSHTFSVNTDQSENADYLNSDLLWAKTTAVSKSADPISLTFFHKLAKVNVTLQPEYNTDEERAKLNDAIISICNIKLSTTIDLSNGRVPTEATGDVHEIKAGVGSTASVIVAPQTICKY